MAYYTVALTGASGAVYGLRLVCLLLKRGDDVDLLVSPSGFLIFREELGIDVQKAGSPEEAVKKFLNERWPDESSRGDSKGTLSFTPAEELSSHLASGSSLRRTMIICPCSMGTLARIAAGVSGNLIERAADCVLKERGLLVLVPRETPLNTIHLENMLRLSRTGAVILPAMPGFYTKPSTVDDMVDFVVGKIFDILGIENDLFRRWNP